MPALALRRSLPFAFAALALDAAPVFAQMRAVDPYQAVITQNATSARCDMSDRFYKVFELASGAIVTVDGESADWARIAYPASGFGFLAAEQADFSAATNTAKLKEASRLKAPHMVSGFEASWKSLLAADLAAGTELRVLEQIKNKDGRVVGYRVPVPDGARAFVARSTIRRATPEEIAAAAGAAKPAAAAPAAVSQPATQPSSQPSGQAMTPPAIPGGTDAPAAGQPSAAPTDPAPVTPSPVDLTQSPLPTGVAPVAGSGATSATEAPVVIENSTAPSAATPATPAATPATPPAAAAPGVFDLEATFQAVRRQDPMTAEIDELMSAYDRLIVERPIGDRRRRQMEQRVEVLKFMRDYRDQRRKVEEANAAARQSSDEFSRRMNEFDLQRQYATVGLLMPSTVYNGQELPLMYRLQSVGGAVPRTLGYIKPTPELSLESKIGVVVGVVGENQYDSSLRLNVINAVRVDPLRAAGNPVRVGN